ncbi:hypothetical protein [Escherichia coli]|uniref:hypothetical protein n=1 Tax=Escherichia coli TaxID=562 RepID=UPI003EF037D0
MAIAAGDACCWTLWAAVPPWCRWPWLVGMLKLAGGHRDDLGACRAAPPRLNHHAAASLLGGVGFAKARHHGVRNWRAGLEHSLDCSVRWWWH